VRCLITGGAGFIGSHLIEHLYKNTDWEVLTLDRLTYAASLDRLAQFKTGGEMGDGRVRFHFHDIRASLNPQLLSQLAPVDYIIHCAAESHVENSLKDPLVFVQSNVQGTFNMLEAAQALQVKRFVMVSTDEVFGPAPTGVNYKEEDRFSPSNPYSATKAGAECLAMAWAKSFGLPLVLTRTMNNFGERQHPEKFVPMVMKRVSSGEAVTIHCQRIGGATVIGSRKWLHARNHADAILFLLKSGELGAFHIAGDELSNLEMADRIAYMMGRKMNYQLVDFHSSRPGHDLRYSLDDSKIRKLGWKPPLNLNESLEKTIVWTKEHQESLVC
jgi:dTDP-glucose 4,6-dehydratase